MTAKNVISMLPFPVVVVAAFWERALHYAEDSEPPGKDVLELDDGEDIFVDLIESNTHEAFLVERKALGRPDPYENAIRY